MHSVVVQPIAFQDALPWLLRKHYARRTAPVSFAFGAYQDGVLLGVVTYGTPVSSSLRIGICGEEWASKVLELNRLCCESRKNLASILVGRSLRLLPKPSVVVSYADTAVGHIGYMYQATNFLYTGLSAKRTDWKVDGLDLHGATIADKTRGMENRAKAIREMYGDAFSLAPRSRKHRYVYPVGTARQRAQILAALRYPVEPYPKGDSQRYDDGGDITTQMTLL